MLTQAIEQVVRQIKSLTLEEQLEVRKILNQMPITTEEIDRQIQEDLLEEGLVTEIKASISLVDKREFKPINIKGKTISETIIEERR